MLQHLKKRGEWDKLDQLEIHLPTILVNIVVTLESKHTGVGVGIVDLRLNQEIIRLIDVNGHCKFVRASVAISDIGGWAVAHDLAVD